jgi:hypothetical protein
VVVRNVDAAQADASLPAATGEVATTVEPLDRNFSGSTQAMPQADPTADAVFVEFGMVPNKDLPAIENDNQGLDAPAFSDVEEFHSIDLAVIGGSVLALTGGWSVVERVEDATESPELRG